MRFKHVSGPPSRGIGAAIGLVALIAADPWDRATHSCPPSASAAGGSLRFAVGPSWGGGSNV